MSASCEAWDMGDLYEPGPVGCIDAVVFWVLVYLVYGVWL